jgi:transposase-like protein
MHGERHDLWRDVDWDGQGLDILVQRRHNKTSATKFCRKLLKRLRLRPVGNRNR